MFLRVFGEELFLIIILVLMSYRPHSYRRCSENRWKHIYPCAGEAYLFTQIITFNFCWNARCVSYVDSLSFFVYEICYKTTLGGCFSNSNCWDIVNYEIIYYSPYGLAIAYLKLSKSIQFEILLKYWFASLFILFYILADFGFFF